MMQRVFATMAIVFFAVISFLIAPLPSNAAGFWSGQPQGTQTEQSQSPPNQSEQNIQADQYAQKDQKDQYAQKDQSTQQDQYAQEDQSIQQDQYAQKDQSIQADQ
jgi:hypothetical protein